MKFYFRFFLVFSVLGSILCYEYGVSKRTTAITVSINLVETGPSFRLLFTT